MRHPVNVYNGLKLEKIKKSNQNKVLSNLIDIKEYQNSKNITKTFYKPISKIL